MIKINIIALIFLLCSCTGNKLIGERFHYTPEPGTILNIGSLTTPTTTGTYTVNVPLIDWAKIDRERRKQNIIIISVGAIFIIITLLIAFWPTHNKPEDRGTFPPIHKTSDIYKFLSEL